MPKKVIVPNQEFNKSDVILDASDIIFPEGYKQYWLNNSQWTLIDSCGRINISYMYNWAKTKDPNITNKRPNEWLSNKSTKELRANYQNLLGFDPVNTVNGGDRVSDNYQSENSRSDNLAGNNDQRENSPFGHQASNNGSLTNISSNGNVQNYGTYMTDRMIISYASWVSFDFKRYVDDIFIQTANNAVSASGLIMSTDELHKENQEVNNRHSGFLSNIDSVPVNLRAPKHILKSIDEYVTWLRTDYNLDISVVEFYKFLCYMGVFYKDGMLLSGESFDLYQPKPQYTQDSPPLFRVIVIAVGGKNIATTFVREEGHNAMIQDIVKAFPQIKPDTV